MKPALAWELPHTTLKTTNFYFQLFLLFFASLFFSHCVSGLISAVSFTSAARTTPWRALNLLMMSSHHLRTLRWAHMILYNFFSCLHYTEIFIVCLFLENSKRKSTHTNYKARHDDRIRPWRTKNFLSFIIASSSLLHFFCFFLFHIQELFSFFLLFVIYDEDDEV